MSQDRILAGRYRLVSHLARGGMADVFQAEDQLLGRSVAVKVLHPQYAADAAFVERFRREAQAAANLQHPNIVGVFDWGEDAGIYFMVMELIEGRTLRDVLRTDGPLLPRRAAEVIADAASALAVAHRAGVFHRDIKPGNIMLAADGTVRVTDFGIARAVGESDELTKTGSVIGTATYFSPEQAQGLPADGRSDIYSLGVVLYELLTGRPPFQGESPVAIAYQHVSDQPVSPRAYVPDLPEDLEAVVLLALEKDPAHRYQTADDLRADLLRFLRGESAAEAPTLAAPTAAARAGRPYEEARPPNQWAFVAGVGALVVALGLGLFLLVRLLSPSDGADLIAVPDLVGQDQQEAIDALQALDLKIRTDTQASDTVAAGKVIATDPSAGSSLERGGFVTIVISSGVAQELMPQLEGTDEVQARATIEARRLVLGTVLYQPSAAIEAGIVITQNPTSGQMVTPGTAVDLVVSSGPDAVNLPNIGGQALQNGLFQLAQAGLNTDAAHALIEEEFSDTVPKGFIIRTDPGPQTPVPKEAIVTIYVSKGPEPVPVPVLVGLTAEAAEAAVEEAGLVFVLDPETVPVSVADGLDGLVAAQNPPAGTEVEPGDTVTVQLGEVQTVVVPSLIGLTEVEAEQVLEALGLLVQIDGTTEVEPDLVGQIISQNPEVGTDVPPGTIIGIIIGIPAETTTSSSTTTTTSTTTSSSSSTSTSSTTTTTNPGDG